VVCWKITYQSHFLEERNDTSDNVRGAANHASAVRLLACFFLQETDEGEQGSAGSAVDPDGSPIEEERLASARHVGGGLRRNSADTVRSKLTVGCLRICHAKPVRID
jgi:hypothetical protein